KPIYRQQKASPSKIILMDLLQVGSKNNINYKLARRFIRNNNQDYYIAGGVKSILDIKRAKHFGASGVLVSTMIHQNKITKYMIQKEKTSSKNRAG
ncbi:HisA/HisF-related TIM barrel protein, partial [Gammaproteobacteria bacterium]|nr:HisA/HisF-related TIM barrel protein [Gammaproteobacteria bacterium]